MIKMIGGVIHFRAGLGQRTNNEVELITVILLMCIANEDIISEIQILGDSKIYVEH